MSANSKIEWTEQTWNPTLGCSKISPGCKGCYAIPVVHRLAGNPHAAIKAANAGLTVIEGGHLNWTGKVRLIGERLEEPLRRRKPTMYFVNSLSDLFHERLSDEAIDHVFAVMALCPQHTFQILTKRAERMRKYFTEQIPLSGRDEYVAAQAAHTGKIVWDARSSERYNYFGCGVIGDVSNRRVWPGWPLPNVWLGVSVENQQYADERIPLLLQTPAAVRFVSAEPLLGPLDLGLGRWISLSRPVCSDLPCEFFPIRRVPPGIYRASSNPHGALSVHTADGSLLGVKPAEFERLPKLDWLIAGGESGPGARPMHPDWVRSLRDQCVTAGVPFFFKRWGEWGPESVYVDRSGPSLYWRRWSGGAWTDEPIDGNEPDWMVRVGKHAAGRLLDGREWDEMPEVRS